MLQLNGLFFLFFIFDQFCLSLVRNTGYSCNRLSPILKGKRKSFQHYLWMVLTTCVVSLICARWGSKYPSESEWKRGWVRIMLQTHLFCWFLLETQITSLDIIIRWNSSFRNEILQHNYILEAYVNNVIDVPYCPILSFLKQILWILVWNWLFCIKHHRVHVYRKAFITSQMTCATSRSFVLICPHPLYCKL